MRCREQIIVTTIFKPVLFAENDKSAKISKLQYLSYWECLPEDTTPCTIITHQAPIRPTFLNNSNLTIINDICTTDE